jgi:hypothetical protein
MLSLPSVFGGSSWRKLVLLSKVIKTQGTAWGEAVYRESDGG